MKGITLPAAAVAALVLASPAGAATIEVWCRQKAIDADTARMTGDLRGVWKTTSFDIVAFTPYFEAKGTELFEGCIDRRRDRSCAGDPSGTLTFEFGFLGLYASPDPASLVWGTCWHPVVSGTAAFAGAQGVLAFVDLQGRQHALHRQPHAEARQVLEEGADERGTAAGLLREHRPTVGGCADRRTR